MCRWLALALLLWSSSSLAALDGWKFKGACYANASDLYNVWQSTLGGNDSVSSWYTYNGSPLWYVDGQYHSPPTPGLDAAGMVQVYVRQLSGSFYNFTAYSVFPACDTSVLPIGDSTAVVWIGLGVIVCGIGFMAGRLR